MYLKIEKNKRILEMLARPPPQPMYPIETGRVALEMIKRNYNDLEIKTVESLSQLYIFVSLINWMRLLMTAKPEMRAYHFRTLKNKMRRAKNEEMK